METRTRLSRSSPTLPVPPPPSRTSSPNSNLNAGIGPNRSQAGRATLFVSTVNVLLFLVLSASLIDLTSGALKFLDWSDKCKDPGLNEYLKPSEECDQSRGFLCQKYSQGFYCGCKINSPLSYDKQSKECRRKITQRCSYEVQDELMNSLSFNQKCHTWAECTKVNVTAYSGSKQTEDTHVCMCREGYVPNKDFSECESLRKNSGSNSLPGSLLVMSTMAGLYYFWTGV